MILFITWSAYFAFRNQPLFRSDSDSYLDLIDMRVSGLRGPAIKFDHAFSHFAYESEMLDLT